MITFWSLLISVSEWAIGASIPIVPIEVTNSFTQEEEIALMKSVYSALKEVFQLSDDAINIRLFAHESHRFSIPPTKNKSETYTHLELYMVISIDCFTGRTFETKRRLYKRLAENLETCGIPQDYIKIVLRESSRENWGKKPSLLYSNDSYS